MYNLPFPPTFVPRIFFKFFFYLRGKNVLSTLLITKNSLSRIQRDGQKTGDGVTKLQNENCDCMLKCKTTLKVRVISKQHNLSFVKGPSTRQHVTSVIRM